MAKSKMAVNIEYTALRLSCGVVNLLPYGAACFLARTLAACMYAVGFKRKRTLERIRSVFPGIDKARARSIAISSLANMLENTVEVIRAQKFDRAWMDANVINAAESQRKLKELEDRGNGVVIMVPHSGNWFMAAWAMAKYGSRLFAIGSRQRNPKINAWLYGKFVDVEVLDRDCRDTLVKIKRYLHAGRSFAIMPDLRVRKPDVEADFFGGKANVSHAGAMFALHAGAPIIVAAMDRENGKHVLHYIATIEPAGRTAADITREVLKLLSDFVMKHPDNWFWYNKRWILEPVSQSNPKKGQNQ